MRKEIPAAEQKEEPVLTAEQSAYNQLLTALEYANRKGVYSLEEAALARNALAVIKNLVEPPNPALLKN